MVSEPPTQPMPRRPPPATVTLPKGGPGSGPVMRGPRDSGALPIRRRLADRDVELMWQAMAAGRSEHDVIQEMLTAFVVEVAAAGGECATGPQLLKMLDPLRLYVVADVRPAEVAVRLALPEPPAAPVEHPIGLGAEREQSREPTPRRRWQRLRGPRWPGRVLVLALALCAVALVVPHLPWLGGTTPALHLASLPWWFWLAPLLPWLGNPGRGGWRWARRRHPPRHRGGHR